jgi:opacity protein-like surface antigen
MNKLIVLAGALGLATATAGEAAAANTGFYIGVVGGQASYDFAQYPTFGFVPGNLSPPPLPIDPAFVTAPVFAGVTQYPSVRAFAFPAAWQPGDDDESAALGALVGFRFNRFLAIETTYLDLGTLEDSALVNLYPSGQTTLRRELHSTGATISALGSWPITNNWSVYARAGALFANMKATTALGDFSDDISFGSQNFIWGAGTQFDWGTHWSLRFDFQRFDAVGSLSEAGRADIDTLTLGVLFRL